MGTVEKSRVSLLMSDPEGRGNKEAMMSYVLAWTLKHASSAYLHDDSILYGYCREILFELLEKSDDEGLEIGTVDTWLEWHNIDVHANIELIRDGISEWHAILIENKIYAPLRNNQLERYRAIFGETYKGDVFKKHYVLISCHESPSKKLEQECERNRFRCLPILKLFPNNRGEDTKSDIFNEFWLREWG